MFAHVLVPVDGSSHATTAARLASSVCEPTGDLTLLHASPDARGAAALFDSAAAIIGGAMGDLREKQALVETQLGTKILTETRAALTTDRTVRTEERQGRPAGTILDALAQPIYDSIAVGTRGRGVVARALLGSTSEAIVRHASKPVLVARHPSVSAILVAVDGSPASRRAIAASLALAERLRIPVSAVLVAEMIWEAPPEAQQAELANQRREYEALLAELTPSDRIRERVVLFGDPTEAILKATAERGTDLVAVGRTGQTPHPRVSLGSTAAKVAWNAHASVLLVP